MSIPYLAKVQVLFTMYLSTYVLVRLCLCLFAYSIHPLDDSESYLVDVVAGGDCDGIIDFVRTKCLGTKWRIRKYCCASSDYLIIKGLEISHRVEK